MFRSPIDEEGIIFFWNFKICFVFTKLEHVLYRSCKAISTSTIALPSSTLCFQKKLEIASYWSKFCTTQSISQTESYPTLIQSAIDQIANFFLHSTEEIKIRGHQKKKIEIRATEKYILSLPRWSLISSCPSYVRFYHCSELGSYLLTWCMHFHKY